MKIQRRQWKRKKCTHGIIVICQYVHAPSGAHSFSAKGRKGER